MVVVTYESLHLGGLAEGAFMGEKGVTYFKFY